MLIVRRPKHRVWFKLTAKVCSVPFVAYLIQSNIMASKLGTTLLTLDVALTYFKIEMQKDAYEARQRRENSYSDREEEKKITMLKNEVYFKVFKAIYWLANEEIASTKITSLLELIEKNGC